MNPARLDLLSKEKVCSSGEDQYDLLLQSMVETAFSKNQP
jgi:hypothetical protein